MNTMTLTALQLLHGKPMLTILIPFYNAEAVLPSCLERLRRLAKQLDLPCELLFVDDGSRDGGAAYLARQAVLCLELRLIRLSRNFGKEAAMTAGLDHARGDAVVVLDGLWSMIKALLRGDAVHGYPSLISVITFLAGYSC